MRKRLCKSRELTLGMSWRLRQSSSCGRTSPTPKKRLGHETLEAFKGIKEVKEEVKQSNLNNIKEHEKTRLCAVGTPGDPKWDSMGEGLLKIERNISNLSSQLDVLRKVLEQVKNDLNRPKDTSTPTSQVSESDLLTSAKFEMEVDKLQKLLVKEVKAKPTPIPPPPPQQPITLNRRTIKADF